MSVHTVTHLAFAAAWAFLGFQVIRSLMTLAKLSRPVAASSAAAVAIAYFLGVTGPLAWNVGSVSDTAGGGTAAPPPAEIVAACPSGAVMSSRSGPGFIDTIGIGSAPAGRASSAIDVPFGTELHLNGWASLTTGPGSTICALDNGRAIAGPVSYGISRPDVAAATGIPANIGAGYSITIKPSRGKHVISVGAVEPDGRSVDKISGPSLNVSVN